ncbi:helix-turn-helix transcriptional regulator [Nostoc sp. TCL240-02]|uniref:helix-turn-helix domain-containing protein n=1 Tax=Nostoc sp. TCL240-02 TaxID=2572090 RepID=UPI00157F839E|nr:helix-turn-helix transcriptional regulator [Nostoc sp. TCL240-02]QKQ75613.1 helix-turn-helix transcriptional regulator [Nostoc sp. TCL240-02]
MQNRIKKFIDERGVSRYKFWQETKLGRDTAYRLCNDSSYIPTGNVLDKICATYKIQPGELLVWLPDEEPHPDAIAINQTPETDEPPKTSKRSRKQERAAGQLLLFRRRSA